MDIVFATCNVCPEIGNLNSGCINNHNTMYAILL